MTDTLKIDLGDGLFALIDAVDAHLAEWGWRARKCRTNTYAERRRAKGGFQSLHRAIMGEPDGVVDHKDGDGLNCTRSNLRVVSQAVNLRNIGPQRNSTTGILGVTRCKYTGRFTARIFHEGKLLHIGTFEHLEAARVARLVVEREFWGVQPRRAEEMAYLEALEHKWAEEDLAAQEQRKE
jgi:hypothetical protein